MSLIDSLGNAAIGQGLQSLGLPQGALAESLLGAMRQAGGLDAAGLSRALGEAGGDVRSAVEARLTPVEAGELARADQDGTAATNLEAALRAGGGGRSAEEQLRIATGFRRELDGNRAALTNGSVPAAEVGKRTELQNAGEMALLNIDIYRDQSARDLMPRGFTALSDAQAQRQFPGFVARDEGSGFYSRIYHDANTGQYVVVNRGTSDGWAPLGIIRGTPDGGTNWDLMRGNRTRQADLALANAARVDRATEGQVRFTGHSLGGALASLQAAQTGRPATVFNPLGLNERVFERYGIDPASYNRNVRSYVVDGDPVAGSNSFFGLRQPSRTTELPARDLSYSANDGLRSSEGTQDAHGMIAAMAGLLYRAR